MSASRQCTSSLSRTVLYCTKPSAFGTALSVGSAAGQMTLSVTSAKTARASESIHGSGPSALPPRAFLDAGPPAAALPSLLPWRVTVLYYTSARCGNRAATLLHHAVARAADTVLYSQQRATQHCTSGRGHGATWDALPAAVPGRRGPACSAASPLWAFYLFRRTPCPEPWLCLETSKGSHHTYVVERECCICSQWPEALLSCTKVVILYCTPSHSGLQARHGPKRAWPWRWLCHWTSYPSSALPLGRVCTLLSTSWLYRQRYKLAYCMLCTVLYCPKRASF